MLIPLLQLTTPRGHIIGDLIFTDSRGNIVDCRAKATQIDSFAYFAQNMRSKAKYLLIIEKHATFQVHSLICLWHKIRFVVLQKLVDEGAHVKHECIMVTAGGYPDYSTRALLCRISYCLPFIRPLCIVDADPHGVEIFLTYKYGPKVRDAL